jgi:signal transduction histidine kinase
MGFALLAAILVAVAVLGVGQLFQVRSDYEDQNSLSFQRELAAEKLRSAFLVEQAARLSDRGPARRAARAAAASGEQLTEEAIGLAGDDPGLQALLERRAEAARAHRARAVRDLDDELISRERGARSEIRDDTASKTRTWLAVIIAGLGLAAAVAVLVFALLIRSMHDPLANLVIAARRLAGGDLRARVTPGGPVETATLGRAFNDMAVDIERAYERIGEGRRRLAVIVDSLADGLITVDSTGRVTQLNEAARAMFPGTETGVHLDQILGGLTPIEGGVGRLLRGANEELLAADATRTLALTSSPLEESAADAGAVISIRDVTERVQMERMKDEFLVTASHELRSPVTSVKGFAELLMLERERLSDSQAEKVEVILESATQLVAVFNDLLDLARSDAGRLKVEARPTDVGPMVDTAARMITASIESKNQELAVDVEPGVPRVIADPARIQQVLSNLLENANKYTPEGGRISISARPVGDEVEISVADSGPGIPADQIEDIFERFSRADASETQLVGGTGLGLAIAKSLVELHGGAIGVTSTPGEGATFRVVLPTADSDSALTTAIERAEPAE